MAESVLISPTALIAKFQRALDEKWGYIYGQFHNLWNATKQANYNKAKAGNADCANSIKYGSKWYGHYVTDCSGLFSWAFKQLGGYMYHGSNTMWNSYCVSKGELRNGKRTDGKELKPGTAIFTYNKATGKRGHVALFIGGGYVIEAKGAFYGVVKSPITESRWVEWGELKGVDYGVSPQPHPEPKPEKGYAIVTGTNLALREGPSTNCKVITRAPTGSKVKIEDPPKEWEYVSYNGKHGYMMKQYLNEG